MAGWRRWWKEMCQYLPSDCRISGCCSTVFSSPKASRRAQDRSRGLSVLTEPSGRREVDCSILGVFNGILLVAWWMRKTKCVLGRNRSLVWWGSRVAEDHFVIYVGCLVHLEGSLLLGLTYASLYIHIYIYIHWCIYIYILLYIYYYIYYTRVCVAVKSMWFANTNGAYFQILYSTSFGWNHKVNVHYLGGVNCGITYAFTLQQ